MLAECELRVLPDAVSFAVRPSGPRRTEGDVPQFGLWNTAGNSAQAREPGVRVSLRKLKTRQRERDGRSEVPDKNNRVYLPQAQCRFEAVALISATSLGTLSSGWSRYEGRLEAVLAVGRGPPARGRSVARPLHAVKECIFQCTQGE